MNTPSNDVKNCLNAESSDVTPAFKMLILFEDELARDQAKKIYHHLLERTYVGRQLETYCWNLKDLAGLNSLAQAITESAIVIVAGEGQSALPAEIETAIQFGLGSKRLARGAVVALLGQSNIKDGQPSALHLFLQKIAVKTGQQFFPGAFELPASDHDQSQKKSAGDQSLQPNRSHMQFGINE